jgi:endonuclease/exonuclease/phosphatase family metal-dependent hydrolase
MARLGVDIAGFSEVTWKRELETPAWSILARGLQMEGSLVARANPWVAGQTREQSDASVQSFGWEEGEYLLSRYPILSSRRYPLNPRTSESEGRAVLHAVVAAPEPIGELSVYVTRLAGDEETRTAQGKDLARIIAETREGRPMLLLADLASDPDSPVVQDLVARGYLDAGAATDLPTCCRETIMVLPGPTPGAETPAEDTPTEEAPAETPVSTPAANPTSTSRRTDYIFFNTWQVESFQLFANVAISGADGAAIYASDHNGIAATFDLTASKDE